MKVLEHSQGLSEVEFECEFALVCPVPNRPYVGKVRVRYRPDKLLLEFISVQDWLSGLDNGTVEDVCAAVFVALWEAARPRWLRVEVEAVAVVHGPARVVKDSRNADDSD